MSRNWIIGLVMVIALGVALIDAPCVFACSCMMPGPPQQELGLASAVFTGTVAQQTAPQGPAVSSADPVNVAFQVDQVWKGQVPRSVIVQTARDSASCGFTFQNGGEYLVYAQTIDGQLSVSLCSRTSLLADAQDDLAALGQGTPPAGEPEGAAPPSAEAAPSQRFVLGAIAAGVLVVLGALTLLGMRLYRRPT
ncbi:MAG TPA: hypothetical protein VFZ66_11555 [Herpetosiphonaceae bacterium]